MAKISGRRGRLPLTICGQLDRPVNALKVALKVFAQRNFVADILPEKSTFIRKVVSLRLQRTLLILRLLERP